MPAVSIFYFPASLPKVPVRLEREGSSKDAPIIRAQVQGGIMLI